MTVPLGLEWHKFSIDAHRTSFRVIVIHPHIRGARLLAAAKAYHWRVSWIGNTGANSGNTVPGKSGWKAVRVVEDQIETVAGHTLLLDVDTKLSDFSNREYFPHVPHYITAIHGQRQHWRTKGVHIIYDPTRVGFRVYVPYDKYINTFQAESFEWSIADRNTRSTQGRVM